MAAENDGVHFRERSSQTVGRNVFAQAVAGVDPDLAARIRDSKEWRKTYLRPVREVVEAGARSGAAALQIANDGLGAAEQQVVFRRAGGTVAGGTEPNKMGAGPISGRQLRNQRHPEGRLGPDPTPFLVPEKECQDNVSVSAPCDVAAHHHGLQERESTERC